MDGPAFTMAARPADAGACAASVPGPGQYADACAGPGAGPAYSFVKVRRLLWHRGTQHIRTPPVPRVHRFKLNKASLSAGQAFLPCHPQELRRGAGPPCFFHAEG